MDIEKMKEAVSKLEKDVAKYEKKPSKKKYEKIMINIGKVQYRVMNSSGKYINDALGICAKLEGLRKRLDKVEDKR